MSYGRSKSELNIDAENLAWLADVLGIPVKADEVDGLAAALANQLPSLAVLEGFDLRDFPPILQMDATWHD